jgi:hypothetical protein
VEAGGAEAADECLGIGDREFDFDFQGHKSRVQGAGYRAQVRAGRGWQVAGQG